MSAARKRTRHLPHARQRQLVAQAQKGDRRARDLLVETNQAFVSMLAEHYHGRGVEHEELVQEGSLGLMRAIEKFDLSRPVNFMTYAAHWIRQGMGRACEQQGTLNRYGTRLPAHVTNAMGRVSRTAPLLERELGRAPTDAELAERCKVTVDTVQMAQRMLAHSIQSIDAAAGDDDDVPVLQVPDGGPEAVDELFERQQTETLHAMVDRLPDAHRKLLARRFGLDDGAPVTERQLTEEWGATRAQLQTLRNEALEALRADAQADQLRAEPVVRTRPRFARPLPKLPSCGHLADHVTLDDLEMEIFSRSEHAAFGRYGSFWWMVTAVDGRLQVRVTDGPDGELFTPAEAAECFAGEQREEVVDFAARLPLEQEITCPSCRPGR